MTHYKSSDLLFPCPPPCHENVFRNGTMVMMTAEIPSAKLEEWVKKVAALSEQHVDWHFAGGRACIKALGDLDRVRQACKILIEEHNNLQREAIESLLPDWREFKPNYVIY